MAKEISQGLIMNNQITGRVQISKVSLISSKFSPENFFYLKGKSFELQGVLKYKLFLSQSF